MYDLSQISNEAVVRAPRIVLLGGAKVGKSTFAAGAPAPVFLPIKREEGIDALKDVGRVPVCNSFEDVCGWLDFLINSEHPYKTVVIDSSSTLEPLIHDYTCRRCDNASSIATVYKGFNKGYDEALREWRMVTDYLDVLRNHRSMTTILIGHVGREYGGDHQSIVWLLGERRSSDSCDPVRGSFSVASRSMGYLPSL